MELNPYESPREVNEPSDDATPSQALGRIFDWMFFAFILSLFGFALLVAMVHLR